MWFHKKAKPDPSEVVRDLREQAFTIAPTEIGITPEAGHQRVWAIVMETGYPNAVASLVALADGTTSLYFSNGGGIIGAGQHDAVRRAVARFIELVDQNADALPIAETHPLPDVGRVRFYARTFEGLRAFEASTIELGEGRHPLAALFHAAHEVITAIREASPQ
jgi:hypothetical protein